MMESVVAQDIRIGEDRYVISEEELDYILTSYRSKVQSVSDWEENAQILESVLRSDEYDVWSQTEIAKLCKEMRNNGTITITMNVF